MVDIELIQPGRRRDNEKTIQMAITKKSEKSLFFCQLLKKHIYKIYTT